MPVQDKDNGLKALLKRLDDSRAVITVGVHAEEGAGAYEGGATVADVATYNEFGTDRIPARPFLSGWFDANVDKIRDAMNKAGTKIVTGTAPDTALEVVAQWAAGQVQRGISVGVPPPNAPSTTARKGSSKPLIATGQLRSSIRGKVKHGSPS